MTRLHVSLPEFLEDPFGSLARARDDGGLADFGLALGVVGYDDVRTLLTDSARLRADFATSSAASGSPRARSTTGWRCRRSTATAPSTCAGAR